MRILPVDIQRHLKKITTYSIFPIEDIHKAGLKTFAPKPPSRQVSACS